MTQTIERPAANGGDDVPRPMLSRELATDVAHARPVPCYVLLRPSVEAPTEPIPRQTALGDGP